MDFILGKSELYDKNIPLVATKFFNEKEKSYLTKKFDCDLIVCPKCGKIPEIRKHQYSDGARYVSILCSCRAGSNRIQSEISMEIAVREAIKNWSNN